MNIDYTKLSRPLVVFVGVAVFVLNYCIIPILLRLFGKDSAPFVIPESVIVGWFAYISAYSIGRSFEKGKGSENKTEE